MGPKIPRKRNDVNNLFQFSDCQSNTKKIGTKFHAKTLNSSQEIEEHTSKQLVQKCPNMAPSREADDVNKNFYCSDHQISATNIYICTKFYEKTYNGSQETEEYTSKWAPGGTRHEKLFLV